ncbi:MAG: uroporphyrinogen-III synthase [Planctomycetota bacterium]|jgi:uroporphyrinogen-III synthase
MSYRASVLVTGPFRRSDIYVAAAQEAGWHAHACEYVSIVPLPFNVGEVPGNVACVCITSKHALPALRLYVDRFRQTPFAAVGQKSTELAWKMGFERVVGASPNAKELAARIAIIVPRESQIFWPRGSLSDELAQDLRGAGFDVFDPIVYENVPLASDEQAPDLTDTGAVFFGSPSAVKAFLGRHREDQCLSSIDAIAIGPTTAKALEAEAALFRGIQVLTAPTPEELTNQLRRSALNDS